MNTVNKIISLLENGQQDEAESEFQIILENGSAEEKFDLAEELTRLGFLGEAVILYKKLLKSFPDEAELILSLAEIYIEIGQEEEAMLLLEQIDRQDNSYPRALLVLADLYQMNGLFEVSEQKLLAAKLLLPEEEVIDFALGELYGEIGKFADAVQYYENVIKGGTTELLGISIHQRIAEMLSASGSFEAALEHYELALEDKLEINTLFGFALTAYQAGENKLAINKFEQIKELDPDYHSLYLYLAKAYENESELDKSLEIITEGIRKDEFNKDLYYYGGRVALKLGKNLDGERLLREAIALDPGFTEAVLTLNKLFLLQERYEDVVDLANNIDQTSEAEPQLLWDEAVAYQQLENYSEALNKYQLAYTYFKNHHEFLRDYGYFLIEEGKTAAAVEIFSELKKQDPSNYEYQETIERLTYE